MQCCAPKNLDTAEKDTSKASNFAKNKITIIINKEET